ncbi:MAG: hypothetical protein OEQ29_17385 [Alphaproteobacteria bacterium]|nr:hypothetical protein [Alphaproteobacteria bacterium]
MLPLPRQARPTISGISLLAAAMGLLAATLLPLAAGTARAEGAKIALPEIRLAVAEMQVIPAYASPRRAPHADHRMKSSPQTVATAWARAKIRAVGRADRARVIILEASVVEVPVKGKSGFLRRGPDRRYDARLTISVEIRSDAGDLIGNARVTATRSQEVLKGVRGDRLQFVWRDLSEKLVDDAARELQRQMQARLGRFLR